MRKNDMRPEKQCQKFTREDTKGYKYYYAWVVRDISKEMCHIIEKSMTATYVIIHGGRLPTHHYLPCFVKKDLFQERKDKAEEWLNEQKNKYGE